MSKQRYNLLRMGLGCFMVVTLVQVFKEFDSVTTGQFVALGLGGIAAIADYMPEKKDAPQED